MIQQIADRAGVSTPTVRHILGNRAEQYRPETRERVLEIARQLGHRPHTSARAMRTGRFGCIALLLSSEKYQSNLPMGLLDGIHDGLAQRNLHLTLARVGDALLTDDQFVPKFLREWMADGAIINYTHNIPERLLSLIRQHELPSVWTNAKLPGDCVHPDDFSGGRRAAEHLLALGHRRVAYVSFVAQTHYSSFDRPAGYASAMREAGLEPRPVIPVAGRPEDNFTVLSGLLNAPDRPTAILVYGDEEALPVLAAAHALGIRVPEELSVVTFASTVAPLHDPLTGRPITSWVLPVYAMGQSAVEMLYAKIENPASLMPCRTLLPTLSEGGTVAPPPRET